MQTSPIPSPIAMRSPLEPKPVELDDRMVTLTEPQAVARGKKILQEFLGVPMEAIATLPAERKQWNNAYLGWVPTPAYANHAVRSHHGDDIDGWTLWYHVDGRVYKVHMARNGENGHQPPYRICAEFILDLAARDLQNLVKQPLEDLKKCVTAADAISLNGIPCFHVEAFCPKSGRKYLFLFRPDGERYNVRSDAGCGPIRSRAEALKRIRDPLTNPYDKECPTKILEMREFWFRQDNADLAICEEEAEVVSPEDPTKEGLNPLWAKARNLLFGHVFDSDEEDDRNLGPKARGWLIRTEQVGNKASFYVDQYGLCVQRDVDLFAEIKQWAANSVNRAEQWEDWRIEDWYPYMLPNWSDPIAGLSGLCTPDLAAIATVTDGDHAIRVLVNLENRSMTAFP